MSSPVKPKSQSVTGQLSAISQALLKHTALSPLFNLSLLLLARASGKGQLLSSQHPVVIRRIRLLFFLNLVRTINSYLKKRSLNNGVSDRYVWSQEIVVVTGGSDGIGAATARILASRGIKVVVLDIQPLTFKAPGNLTFIECDVASASAVAEAALKIRSSVGDPTVIINNAAVMYGKPLLEASETEITKTFQVNTIGSFWLTKQFLPSMISKNHGMIAVVTSLAAYVPAARSIDYAASKAAASTFIDGLAEELRSHYQAPKVRTIHITPGLIDTEMSKGIGGKHVTSGTEHPETIAQQIVDAVLGGESTWLTYPNRQASKSMETFEGRKKSPAQAALVEKDSRAEDNIA